MSGRTGKQGANDIYIPAGHVRNLGDPDNHAAVKTSENITSNRNHPQQVNPNVQAMMSMNGYNNKPILGLNGAVSQGTDREEKQGVAKYSPSAAYDRGKGHIKQYKPIQTMHGQKKASNKVQNSINGAQQMREGQDNSVQSMDARPPQSNQRSSTGIGLNDGVSASVKHTSQKLNNPSTVS